MEKLDKFQGHIILYCKGYYDVKGASTIEGLQRIWAVRCGYDAEYIDNSSKEYIADEMCRILQIVRPKIFKDLWQTIHRELSKTYLSQYEGLSAIEILIMLYRREIMTVQVRDGKEVLISLPKPQKQLFRRIARGNAKSGDYNLVKG